MSKGLSKVPAALTNASIFDRSSLSPNTLNLLKRGAMKFGYITIIPNVVRTEKPQS